MSAYIVDDRTISVIVKAFSIYGVNYKAENYKLSTQERNEIGQSLLDQNCKSVNYRYNENTKTPKFEYVDVTINEGLVYGCIKCYEYQACETENYFYSELHFSLQKLKEKLLEKLLKKTRQIVPWGYEDY